MQRSASLAADVLASARICVTALHRQTRRNICRRHGSLLRGTCAGTGSHDSLYGKAANARYVGPRHVRRAALSGAIPVVQSGLARIVFLLWRKFAGILLSVATSTPDMPKARLFSADRIAFHKSSGRPWGFTLIEMLVTLSVLAIIVAIAIPSFAPTVRNNQLFSIQTEIMSSLSLARNEAAKRGVPVGVGIVSAPVVNGNEWGNGWTVWVDQNGNSIIDAGEPSLRTHEPLATGFKLSVPNAGIIEFDSHGFLSLPVLRQLKLCSSVNGTSGYQITIQPNGMVDSATVSCP